jgi:DNA-binding protein H-NS
MKEIVEEGKINKYHYSKIYKLVSKKTNDIYVGSTCIKYLSSRIGQHKNHYKLWKNGTGTYLSSFIIIEYDDCTIELIEQYKCNSKKELREREQYYIDTIPNCINKRNAYTDHNEHMKKYHITYYQKNKDILKERQKKYRKSHKEEISKKQMEKYYADKLLLQKYREQLKNKVQ